MAGLLFHKAEGGIDDASVEALSKSGITTILDVISGSAEAISARVPSVQIGQLVDTQRRLIAQSAPRFRPLDELWKERASRFEVRTCTEIDGLIGAGLVSGEVLELAGRSGSGKTWLCLAACAHAALALRMSVLYIDVGLNFCAKVCWEEMQRIALELGIPLDPTAMRRIRVVRAHDIDEVVAVLQHVSQQPRGEGSAPDSWHRRLGLVIVDSPAQALNPLLSKDSAGQIWIVNMSRSLRLVARCNVAVLITNILVASDSPLCGDVIADRAKPALGNSWRSVTDTRIVLSASAAHPSSPSEPRSCTALLEKCSRRAVGQFVSLRRSQTAASSDSQALTARA